MAEQVENKCPDDTCSLLTDMGVHVKPSFAPTGKKSRDVQFPLGAQEDGERCRCKSYDNHRQNGLWGGRLNKGTIFAMLFCCGTLILSIFSLAFVLYCGYANTTQTEELWQKIHRLEALCGSELGSERFAWQKSGSYPLNARFHADERIGVQNFVDGPDGDYEDDDDDDDEFDEEDDSPYAVFAEKKRQKRSSRRKRARNGNGNSKKNNCKKKLKKCIKARENGRKLNKKCQNMLKCLPPSTGPKPVHFTSVYEKDARLQLRKEANWTAGLYKGGTQQPIKQLGDGGFSVLESGVYYIYNSVMFHDLKYRMSQAIKVNNETLFKCMDSIDYVDTNQTAEEQLKYKTCSITGTAYLKAGSRLEIQNLYPDTEIDQNADSTYFGAILLFPIELPGK